jgi:uncharacterized protein (DUF2235 family)
VLVSLGHTGAAQYEGKSTISGTYMVGFNQKQLCDRKKNTVGNRKHETSNNVQLLAKSTRRHVRHAYANELTSLCLDKTIQFFLKSAQN